MTMPLFVVEDYDNNFKLTLQKLKAMLRIQNTLNQKVNSDWKNAGYPWRDAIMVEAVELFDHLQWKWWKKPGPVDWGQVRMEAVDIWHFLLSEALEELDTIDLDKESNVSYLNEMADNFYILSVNQDKENINVPLLKVYVKDLIGGSAHNHNFQELLSLFAGIIEELGMSFDDLYKSYIGKTKLNEFRWANGYGGQYVKDWSMGASKSLEDNQYLTTVLDSLDVNDPNFPEQVTVALTCKYYKVELYNRGVVYKK